MTFDKAKETRTREPKEPGDSFFHIEFIIAVKITTSLEAHRLRWNAVIIVVVIPTFMLADIVSGQSVEMQ